MVGRAETQAVVGCLQAFWEAGDLVVAKARGLLLGEITNCRKIECGVKGRISRLKCGGGN